ncbi:hypothetical protein [Collimonas fungivorans]|uniref:hypothetical protein n=1 Tax=Collimonas fungivorans TaxID=158899 RepID=UPI0005A2C337|nr:hypothetical protein [Collimonas fungivorans]
MNLVPKTILTELDEKIDKLIALHTFVSKDSADFISALREIDKVGIEQAPQATRLRAVLLAIAGENSLALKALRDLHLPEFVASCEIGLMANMGLCLEAQPLYAKYSGPNTGNFTKDFELGLSCGAIRQVASFLQNAKKMSLTNLESIPMDIIENAEKMLNEFEISDVQIGQLMDVVGSVLQDEKMFYIGTCPEIEVIDLPGVLRTTLLTYSLPTSSDRAVDLYLDFIDRLGQMSLNIPSGLQINFSGAGAR